jgi:hypothetical protein
MDYPDNISPYVYRRGFDKYCQHNLTDKGIGAFAFLEIAQSAKAMQKNERMVAKAWATYRGDYHRVNKVANRAGEVGIVILTNGGIFTHLVLSCRAIRQSGKEKDALFEDFVKGGMPIDPAKFWDPAAMYRVPAYL